VVLVGVAVLAGLRAVEPPPAPTTKILVAGRELRGGAALRPGDLASVPYPVDAVPAGALTAAAATDGRVLAGALRRGEPVTDARLVAPGILDGYPGTVAVPVRLADPAAVALLHAGDRVDLIAAAADGGGATVVVADAPVLAVPPVAEHAEGLTSGALLVVAVSEASALSLAEASVSAVLSVALDH
jgi:pilus assembly protein CpaB